MALDVRYHALTARLPLAWAASWPRSHGLARGLCSLFLIVANFTHYDASYSLWTAIGLVLWLWLSVIDPCVLKMPRPNIRVLANRLRGCTEEQGGALN